MVDALSTLLNPHLALEEAELVPFLRDAKEFPLPPTDQAVDMYADGFAWAMNGIAPDVVEQLSKMLPALLLARIPAARVAFEARCMRAWGTTQAGASTTPIPSSNLSDVEDER